jgi:hypothetical protein
MTAHAGFSRLAWVSRDYGRWFGGRVRPQVPHSRSLFPLEVAGGVVPVAIGSLAAAHAFGYVDAEVDLL